MELLLEAINPALAAATTVPSALGSTRVEGRQPKKTDGEPTRDPIMNCPIMILDDERFNVLVVSKYLRDVGYSNLLECTDSSAAIKIINQSKPSLLLLDIMMPKVTGLDILRALQLDKQVRRLPVLILTATNDSAIKREALDMGASDFLLKPVDPNDLIPRVRNALTTMLYEQRLAQHAEKLEQEVRTRTAELAASRQEVIHCLARAAEYRDDFTGHHVVRVGRYAGIIARELGFTEADVETLELAAQLHDVGKIGIPDAILNSNEKLDPEQFSVMQRHCSFAKKILTPLAEHERRTLQTHAQIGASLLEISSSPILMLAARIAQTHHEWWNGKGYPLGLAGDDIPLEGRITAVADVFDALSTARSYKAPIPREKCLDIMAEERGTHFDPRVLDAFFTRSKEVVQIQMECMDI